MGVGSPEKSTELTGEKHEAPGENHGGELASDATCAGESLSPPRRGSA